MSPEAITAEAANVATWHTGTLQLIDLLGRTMPCQAQQAAEEYAARLRAAQLVLQDVHAAQLDLAAKLIRMGMKYKEHEVAQLIANALKP